MEVPMKKMVHRRELLKAGAGLVVAAPLRIPFRILTEFAGVRSNAPDVMVNRGISCASEMISAARENARHARVVDIDNTILIRKLSETWMRRPHPLFGMTSSDIAMLVEALASDHGMAIVYRGWHDLRSSGAIHHVLYGNPNVIAMLRCKLVCAGADFGKVLGHHVVDLAASSAWPVSINFEVDARHLPPEQVRFLTWAVAPVRRGVSG
jgi:hypothetical protein